MLPVSGFTFVRNAIRYDYPVVESIRSILVMCDEVVVAVGQSDDGTRELIASIPSPKIRIIDTVWDESLREGGAVLAAETNKALDAISPKSVWAIYIQADEVFHEENHLAMKVAMERWGDDLEVEGLLVNYFHFYGSYDYIGDSRRWYRKEVRVIRNDKRIRSYRDAQGFRKDGKPLRVRDSGLPMYHYGWVKPPQKQQAKLKYFHSLWHDDEWMEKNRPKVESFNYSDFDSLKRFEGTHPVTMKKRIEEKNWEFGFDPSRKKFNPASRLLYAIERMTGYRPGEYRNYRLIRDPF
jgi:glycosyltransferase involved in cell wall biosynthesis